MSQVNIPGEGEGLILARVRQCARAVRSIAAPPKGKFGAALRPFREFLKAYRWLLGTMAALAAMPVVLEFVFHAGPPWPTRQAAALFTAAAAWVVLISTYARKSHADDEEWLEARFAASRRVSCWAAIIYLALTALFVRPAPTSQHREARGFLQTEATKTVLARNPGLTVDRYWKEHGYDPEEVWVPETVAAVRFGLLGSWLVGFTGLTLLAATFLLQQQAEAAGGAVVAATRQEPLDEHHRRLGKAIRARRLELGLDQATLARRVEIPKEWLSKLERGLLSPDPENSGRLAEALGMTLEAPAQRVAGTT